MKKIYTLLLSVMITGSAFSQGGTSDSKVKFGIKAGVNFANVSINAGGFNISPKSITSFHFGGLVDYSISDKLSLQPGLILNGKGYKFEMEPIKQDVNLMYLEIPVNMVYNVGGFYFGAGPYAAFGVSGKEKFSDSDNSSDNYEEDIKFGSGDEEVKGTDFGVNFLVGYKLKNGINFGAGYGLGLSNLSNDSSGEVKNKVFSVSLGFTF